MGDIDKILYGDPDAEPPSGVMGISITGSAKRTIARRLRMAMAAQRGLDIATFNRRSQVVAPAVGFLPGPSVGA